MRPVKRFINYITYNPLKMKNAIVIIIPVAILIQIAPFNSAQSTDCIATVGTKTFCADTTEWRTWPQAKAYCTSRGWALASIVNQTEVDELSKAYDATVFFGDYWINGRDIQAPEQFVWDYHTETNPARLDVRIHRFIEPVNRPPYQTCLVYASLTGERSGFGYWPCANQLATLCERPT